MPRRISDDPDDPEFQVIGIATAMRDFRLAYYLNRTAFLGLKKGDDFPPAGASGKSTGHSYYAWEEKGSLLGFFLVSNRSEEGFLVPDLKQADFFLCISGGLPRESLTRIINSIRTVPNVLTAYSINLKTSKTMTLFLQELELHNLGIRRSVPGKPS